MGRGDRRTRKGKTWRGTYGKSRPRPSNDESGSKGETVAKETEKKEKKKPAKEEAKK